MSTDSIVFAEDDPAIHLLLKKLLTLSGFTVRGVTRGDAVMQALEAEAPSLLLLDWNMPGASGLEVLQRVRAHPRLRELAVIMLTARSEVDDRIVGMDEGADDYLPKPYDDRELVTRIRAAIRRRQQSLEANPLTLLPGNRAIHRELERRLASGEPLAVGYLDVDNFKVYNDVYGFAKGDEAIRRVARVITEFVPDFVGHIGGDDFVFFTVPDKVDGQARAILERFKEELKTLYTEEDIRGGIIVGHDRQGKLQAYSLMSLSIMAVTNDKVKLKHPAEVAQIASELKGFAKKEAGNVYVRDRRSDIFRITRDTPA